MEDVLFQKMKELKMESSKNLRGSKIVVQWRNQVNMSLVLVQ